MLMRVSLIALALLSLTALPAAAKPPVEPRFVDSPLLKKAPLPDDFSMGTPNAQIVLIEYASLSCPHCAHFHKETLPELKKRYIDTGKMLYILRQFPLNEPALKGALLADCMGEDKGKDAYYTFSRVLFEGQDKWAFDMNFQSSLEAFARVGGVSKERFDACMTDSKREIKLLTVKKDANTVLGVNRTPFFFINGKTYEGDPDPEAMTTYFDQMLGIEHVPVEKKTESKAVSSEGNATSTKSK